MRTESTSSPPGAPRLVLTLTSSQQRNLLGFLQRASIIGREVPAYHELFSLISSARPLPAPGPSSAQSSITDQQSSIP